MEKEINVIYITVGIIHKDGTLEEVTYVMEDLHVDLNRNVYKNENGDLQANGTSLRITGTVKS